MSYGGKINTADQILDQIISVAGLFEKIFGKLLDQLVFDRKMDDNVNFIRTVYGYEDAPEIFPRRIDRKEFRNLSKIVFRFQEYGALQNNGNKPNQ